MVRLVPPFTTDRGLKRELLNSAMSIFKALGPKINESVPPLDVIRWKAGSWPLEPIKTSPSFPILVVWMGLDPSPKRTACKVSVVLPVPPFARARGLKKELPKIFTSIFSAFGPLVKSRVFALDVMLANSGGAPVAARRISPSCAAWVEPIGEDPEA